MDGIALIIQIDNSLDNRASKRHELTVENDEKEMLVKVDESELPGDPSRFRITKEDLERIGFSDGCVGCMAMR